MRRRFVRGAERRIIEQDFQISAQRRKGERRLTGLGWISLFREIDEVKLLKLMADFEVLILPVGYQLLKPGENNDSIFILLSGSLVVYFDISFDSNASTQINPGECIGELSAIDGKPVSAFVLAAELSQVLVLPAEVFWNCIMPIPGIGRNLLAALSERMRHSNEVRLEAQRKQLNLKFLQKELEVARQLQAGMLPIRSPMFPERTDIEIAGVMEPASEIGGDLFDAFFVDENLLFFCIGDVSGHGIPAALFMARTIGLMRIAAMSTNRPDHLLERLNRQLCEGNDANMFVTLLCGFLDIGTGKLTYSNAGHCPPLLLNANGVSSLAIPKGCLVGVIENAEYLGYEIKLGASDVLVCYTDGVIEAQTEVGEEFSVERLMAIVESDTDLSLENLLLKIRREVGEFTRNKDLGDDCTMLAMRWRTYSPGHCL